MPAILFGIQDTNMADNVLTKTKTIHYALETGEGTYVAPSAAQYILAEVDKPQYNVQNVDSVDVFSTATGFVSKSKTGTKSAKYPLKVPLSWPSVAPAAAAGFLNCAPLLQSCGSAAPLYAAGPPATHTYTDAANILDIKSGSLTLRRVRGGVSNKQLEKKSAGCKGKVGFELELGKIPRFTVELIGSQLALASATTLTSTPATQLTNIANTLNANMVALATVGGNSVCLYKASIPNLFRHEADWTQFGCGDKAQSKVTAGDDIKFGFKFPDITTEFNPDDLIDTELSLAFTLVQEGGARSLLFSLPTCEVTSWDEFDMGDELGCELTIKPLSAIQLKMQ